MIKLSAAFMMLVIFNVKENIMRYLLALSLVFILNLAKAEQTPDFVSVPEPPELPMQVESGEILEPDISIIRKGKDTIQEFRKNGKLYMVKIIPIVGPPYYLINTDGDGSLDVSGSDLDKGSKIHQWKLLEWH